MNEKEKKKCLIITWKPREEDVIVTSDGKLFVILFEKIFNNKSFSIYDRFFIKKGSYENQLEVITKYINFFMHFYDLDDELALAYLKIKYALDKEKKLSVQEERLKQEEIIRQKVEDNPELEGKIKIDDNEIISVVCDKMIELIYELIFTDSIVSKIDRMVEENYFDDIESSDDKDKYLTKEKKHLESLEFTNNHVKILLKISFGMKVISPLLFHFVYLNLIKLDRDSDIIFKFYEPLFDIFGKVVTINEDGTELIQNVNMYNKLFVYVKAKVLESKSHNATIFEQRDIFGVDEYTVIHLFLKKVLISENMVKYKFNEHWDPKLKKYKENIVGFNKTIIKYQLSYFLKDQYSKTLTEVTNSKNSDGLSGMDKMEMNLQKIDEGIISISEANVKTGLKRLLRDNDFEISDDEINYYIKYHNPCKLQVLLVYSYYSKYFGSYRNMNQITRREYIILLLILKKRLLVEAGYDDNDNEFSETSKLPYILTGNMLNKVNTRIIRNNKFISKVEISYLYENLINKKYYNLNKIKPDYILSLLSQVINTPFTYVVYEDQSLLGKEIEYNEDKISDELLFFLNNI